jgi:hypothetical protein
MCIFSDNVFFTCCVLHNKIQKYKGFDTVWEGDRDWMGRDGLFGNEHVGNRKSGVGKNQISYTVVPQTDFSRAGQVGVAGEEDFDFSQNNQWREFGEKLARHYTDLKKNGKLQWPKGRRMCVAQR